MCIELQLLLQQIIDPSIAARSENSDNTRSKADHITHSHKIQVSKSVIHCWPKALFAGSETAKLDNLTDERSGKYYAENLKLDNVTALMMAIIVCVAVCVIVLMTMVTVSIPM